MLGGETGAYPSNSHIVSSNLFSKLDLEYHYSLEHSIDLNIRHTYTHADPHDELRLRALGYQTLFESRTQSLTAGLTHTFTSEDRRWVNALTGKYYHYSMSTRQSDPLNASHEEKEVSISKHYFVAAGMFSMMPDYKSGIIRVKKGTTEIDPSYNWVINDQDVEGEKGHGRLLVTTYYAGNGVAYGVIDMPEYWSNPMYPNWNKDRSLIAVEMNIYTRTVKKLPIPKSCAYAAHIAPYYGKILFASWGEKSSGFYLYDPATGKASDKALIEMPGFLLWCQEMSLK